MIAQFIILSTVTVLLEGWHCVERSTPIYSNAECHGRWVQYRKAVEGQTSCNPQGLCTSTLLYIVRPGCADDYHEPCLREMGYGSDGRVYWRKPLEERE